MSGLLLIGMSTAVPAGADEGRVARCDKLGMGILSRITLSAIPDRVSACTPFTVVVQAWDGCGFPMRDLEADVHWSDSSGSLAPAEPTRLSGGTSTHQIRIGRPISGNRLRVVVEGVSTQSEAFDVTGSGPAHHLAFEALPERQRACSSFTVVAVARDACGNKVRSFDSAAAWSDTSGNLQPSAPSPFVAGVSVTRGARIPHPYTQDRIRLQASGLEAQGGPFDVEGFGAFERIAVDPIRSPQRKCKPFTVTARALDACGNLVESHSGPARWSDHSGKLRPARPSEFVDGISLTRNAQVRKKKPGNVIVIQSGGKSGESGAFDVVRTKWRWP